MANRVTAIAAKELQLEHIHRMVTAGGASGQLLRFERDIDRKAIGLLLGPTSDTLPVIVAEDAPVMILDAYVERKEVKHWAQ